MYDYFPFCNMPYGLGWPGMILFWLLIIICIILIVRWLTVKGVSGNDMGITSTHTRTSVDILNERYAKGEIDREEFLQRLNDLRKG
ncbi:MAG: SHOCT domain-containing protein [Gammaproteobacteria bacterium]|nr:SHOCT domain-containing protein [Gammaproteobacteria bacterium]